VDSSFDLISSNKVANTLSYGFIGTKVVLKAKRIIYTKPVAGAGVISIEARPILEN
jgi:hypothetical protein